MGINLFSRLIFRLISRQLAIALIFAVTNLTAFAGFATSQPVNCDAFISRAFTNSDLKSQESIQERQPKPTVEVIGSKAGRFSGGRLNIIKRTGNKWHSTYAIGAAIQGDPRTAALLVGGDLARFLGISVIDDQHMEVPNSAEFNGRLKELNVLLAKKGFEPIQVQFADVNDTADDYKFLQMFLKSLTTPLAMGGVIYVHDVSYHLGLFVVPNSFVNQVRQVVQMQSQFIDHLKNRLNQVQNKKQIQFYQSIVPFNYESEAMFLDTVLGNTVAYSANVVDMKRSIPVSINDEKLSLPTEDFGAIQGVLYEEYMDFFGKTKGATLRTAFEARRLRYIHADLSADEKVWLTEDMAAFIEKNPDIAWDAPLGNFDPEHILYIVNQRIEELQKALAGQ